MVPRSSSANDIARTAHHLIGEQFNDLAGTDVVHVAYKGMGVEVLASTPKELTARMDADTVRGKAVIDSANIKVD